MKKNAAYLLCVAFFLTSVILVVYKYTQGKKRDAIVPLTLKERNAAIAKGNEWDRTRKMAAYYTEAVRENPDNIKALLALASIFIQESRITGDYLYYDAAAMNCTNRVLEKDSMNFEALILKALVHLSQHHFADGIAVAEKAQKINPYNAFVYGILVDGNVEMGNYAAAVENSDKMVSIRPDLRSYSRISYLREIHGDNDGAIEAMDMAVEAGAPGDEPTEWARVHLGQLFEHINNWEQAERCYQISLQERQNYAYALAGMSRIAEHSKDFDKAIQYLVDAQKGMKSVSFREDLIKVYKEKGETAKAKELAESVIKEMEEAAEKAAKDPNAGHYTDKELALAYLEVKDYNKALDHALMEYNRRPKNIDANETVAWVYYNMGKYQKALPYIHAAMKTKSKNPTLLSRAALIFKATGNAFTSNP